MRVLAIIGLTLILLFSGGCALTFLLISLADNTGGYGSDLAVILPFVLLGLAISIVPLTVLYWMFRDRRARLGRGAPPPRGLTVAALIALAVMLVAAGLTVLSTLSQFIMMAVMFFGGDEMSYMMTALPSSLTGLALNLVIVWAIWRGIGYVRTAWPKAPE